MGGAALDVFSVEPPPADIRCSGRQRSRRLPHIGGSTEEAQEIVGVRIAEQVVEYLNNGVAITAVNMPALTPAQYRTLGPYAISPNVSATSPHTSRWGTRTTSPDVLRQDR